MVMPVPETTKQLQKKNANGKHHIIMVGSSGVGKTALASRLRDGKFPEDHWPTRVDSFSKTILLDGVKCVLEILDTAGRESYVAMRDNYYRGGEGFICVFSVTDRQSFEDLRSFHQHICEVINRDDPPILLLATKCDQQLADEPYLNGEVRRKVTRAEGEELAKQWGTNCEYMEASALDGIGVQEAFASLAKKVMADKGIPITHAKPLRSSPLRSKHKVVCSSCKL